MMAKSRELGQIEKDHGKLCDFGNSKCGLICGTNH